MKLTVLVADDEKNIREGLREALALDGYDVALAADGHEAWETVNKGDIDLVITDLKMPHMSGEDLLRNISSQFPTVPVIILTGHGTIESAVQAMHDGAYDFLTKPVNLDRLSLMVKRALGNRELALQNRAMQEELERREPVCKHHRQERGDEAGLRDGAPGGAFSVLRAHHGRERLRERDDCRGPALQFTAQGQAVHQASLRGPLRVAAGKRAASGMRKARSPGQS